MNKYLIIKQKVDNQYLYCGLYKINDYFIGSDREIINETGKKAFKKNGLIVFDPIENGSVFLSLNQGNLLVKMFANGKKLKPAELKQALTSELNLN